MERVRSAPDLGDGGQLVAFVFPGQGSQFVGMGQKLHEVSDVARRVFQQADELLGFSLSTLCFEGPADVLEDTLNAQPAILTVSLAALAALKQCWHAAEQTVTPSCVAGHSLGEFSALVAAGALEFGDALGLVRERGRLMQEAGMQQPGGMAAVLGLERDELTAVCAEASARGGIVVLANDNCPGQSVISGDLDALRRAMDLASERGAKRVVRLDISIASHSPLMTTASDKLGALVAKMAFHEPLTPIVSNVSGRFVTSVEELKRNVAQQVIRPVQWTGSVREMLDHGVTTFLEIGPGAVLSGLIRRVKRDAPTLTAADFGLPLTASQAS